MCINVLNMDVNMINSKIEKAFNAQINAEIYSNGDAPVKNAARLMFNPYS